MSSFPLKFIPEAREEISAAFLQGMVDRMMTSFYKYGAVRDAYPHRVNALESLQARLDRYKATGNTEYLIDAANFAMIEFMAPAHPKAFFAPTDSRQSPGRKWSGQGEIDLTQRPNRDKREE